MIAVYHRLAVKDWNDALDHYESESIFAGDSFKSEFEVAIARIKAMPTRYSPYFGSPIFRRARLSSFPYLIIYRIIPSGIRITVIKHESRHPRYGMTRW